MTEDEEEQRDQARRVDFLLEATRELVAALEAEQVRDPGDEVAESTCAITLAAASIKAREAVRYFDRRKLYEERKRT